MSHKEKINWESMIKVKLQKKSSLIFIYLLEVELFVVKLRNYVLIMGKGFMTQFYKRSWARYMMRLGFLSI